MDVEDRVLLERQKAGELWSAEVMASDTMFELGQVLGVSNVNGDAVAALVTELIEETFARGYSDGFKLRGELEAADSEDT